MPLRMFDRAHEKSHEKSYSFLHQSMKNLIDRERLRETGTALRRRTRLGSRTPRPHPPKAMVAVAERVLRVVVGRRNVVARVIKFAISSKRVPAIRGKSVHLSTSKRISLELNHPEEQRHVHHQGATTMIRGRKCPRKKWPKPHVSIMPREKCRRGDKCFYKHDDKAAAATKDTKRANSPSPKKKSKDSTAAPCLIQKLPALSRKQPKATSCSDESNVSMKRLRFRKVPHVIEVKAVGRQVPVKHRPREFTKVYKTAEDVPVSSKVEQHEAQVRARQLQETVKLHDSDVAPSCGFCCWNEDTCDVTCKECRFVSGPKALREIGRFPSIATAAPKPASVGLLIQEVNPISCLRVCLGMLAQELPCSRASDFLSHSHGSTEANEVADVKLSALPDPVHPYVLDHTPAVLSVGTRCVDQGYSFVWPANGKPILVRPDDKVVQLKIEGHVPVLDDSLQGLSQRSISKG